MTHHFSTTSRPRVPNLRQKSPRQSFAAAAPTEIAAARASMTLALSMMVALRYLEGRSDLAAATVPAEAGERTLS